MSSRVAAFMLAGLVSSIARAGVADPGCEDERASVASNAGFRALAECFRDPAFELAQAKAAFGSDWTVARSSDNGRFVDFEAGKPTPDLRSVRLESGRGELIGIVIEYERTAVIDVAALVKDYGPVDDRYFAMDSFEPPTHTFYIEDKDFTLLLYLDSHEAKPPLTARPIHQVILRRIPQRLRLPKRWDSAEAVARLVPALFYRVPPDAAYFAGFLGRWGGQKERVVTFDLDGFDNNLTESYVELESPAPAEAPAVSGIFLRFARPITIRTADFVRSVDGTLAVSSRHGEAKVDVAGGGRNGYVLFERRGTGSVDAFEATAVFVRRRTGS